MSQLAGTFPGPSGIRSGLPRFHLRPAVRRPARSGASTVRLQAGSFATSRAKRRRDLRSETGFWSGRQIWRGPRGVAPSGSFQVCGDRFRSARRTLQVEPADKQQKLLDTTPLAFSARQHETPWGYKLSYKATNRLIRVSNCHIQIGLSGKGLYRFVSAW